MGQGQPDLSGYAKTQDISSKYAEISHNHNDIYYNKSEVNNQFQPKGSYALTNHTHNNYALTDHTHGLYALTNHTHSNLYYTKDESNNMYYTKNESDTAYSNFATFQSVSASFGNAIMCGADGSLCVIPTNKRGIILTGDQIIKYGQTEIKGGPNPGDICFNDLCFSRNELNKLKSTSQEILPYPPVNLTSDITLVSGQPYGNGNYVVTTSSYYFNSEWNANYPGFKAFSNNRSDFWHSVEPIYNNISGNYSGSAQTPVNNVNHLGEWIQIQLPIQILLSSYTMAPRQDYNNSNLPSARSPSDFILVGSNDGINWTLLHNVVGENWNVSSKTFSIANNNQKFSYYRLIVKKVGNLDSPSNKKSVQISQFKLIGSV